MKKLLLHCCCAVCASSVIERLLAQGEYEITAYFSNSNIMPKSEYEKRRDALSEYIAKVCPNVLLIEDEYDNKRYLGKVLELVQEKEGGKRCAVCIYDRLERTALFAKENGFDIFTTTLSVSPHKNAELINSLGNEISRQIGVEFLPANFKKQNGFLRSTQLAKEHNIYRQNYCGCKFE